MARFLFTGQLHEINEKIGNLVHLYAPIITVKQSDCQTVVFIQNFVELIMTVVIGILHFEFSRAENDAAKSPYRLDDGRFDTRFVLRRAKTSHNRTTERRRTERNARSLLARHKMAKRSNDLHNFAIFGSRSVSR